MKTTTAIISILTLLYLAAIIEDADAAKNDLQSIAGSIDAAGIPKAMLFINGDAIAVVNPVTGPYLYAATIVKK